MLPTLILIDSIIAKKPTSSSRINYAAATTVGLYNQHSNLLINQIDVAQSHDHSYSKHINKDKQTIAKENQFDLKGKATAARQEKLLEHIIEEFGRNNIQYICVSYGNYIEFDSFCCANNCRDALRSATPGNPSSNNNNHANVSAHLSPAKRMTVRAQVTDKYQLSLTIHVTVPSIVLLNPGDEGSLTATPITKKEIQEADYWARRAIIYKMGPNESFYKVQPTSASGTTDAPIVGPSRPLLGHPNEFEMAQREWLDANNHRRAAVVNDSFDRSSSIPVEGLSDESDIEMF
ncbi:unnamed protein product [Rotaria sp. Silwood1]|nr:unnamed protein product [Rotaria sp. Silwood1]CAF1569565.1 unnamed protein product [Rotaria sp. Silwood1]